MFLKKVIFLLVSLQVLFGGEIDVMINDISEYETSFKAIKDKKITLSEYSYKYHRSDSVSNLPGVYIEYFDDNKLIPFFVNAGASYGSLKIDDNSTKVTLNNFYIININANGFVYKNDWIRVFIGYEYFNSKAKNSLYEHSLRANLGNVGVYIEYKKDTQLLYKIAFRVKLGLGKMKQTFISPIYIKNDNDIAANVEASARLYFKYKKRNYFLYSQVFKELDNISINGAIGIGMSFE